ncbi:MAG: hypothetical protein J6U31_08665 [Bacteroidales bacterium]|nr:hypothetical protein [Bacteroidales bacterium]
MEGLLNVARKGGGQEQTEGHKGRQEGVMRGFVRPLGALEQINGIGRKAEAVAELLDADARADGP